MAEQEMAITGPQMHGTQYAPNITVFPDRDPNDNRGIRIPRRAFKMTDTETVVGPDINNPKDGNKIVSPDNLHTDPVADKVVPDAVLEVKETPVAQEAPVAEVVAEVVAEAPAAEPVVTPALEPVLVPATVLDKPNEG